MKNDYFKLTTEQQRTVLEQTATRLSLPKQAAEKDLWVSATLQTLFTLPCADSLVFKGGSSLAKVWKMIFRFSEDIDLAIDRGLFDLEGDLTKKKVKRLRKESSLFVKETLFSQLQDAVSKSPMSSRCELEAQPDGEGDNTYPEPRSIFIRYQSVFDDSLGYIAPIVKVEAGARSLLEPFKEAVITSMVEETLPNISTTVADAKVKTAIPEKTFLEKSFLLHELFSVSDTVDARRRSRHIYDLHKMMEKGIHKKAIADDDLWQTIHHHRSTLTSMHGVDYTPDIRDRICLVPPEGCRSEWERDYREMTGAMIYGDRPTFEELTASMQRLEQMFRQRMI